MAFALLFAKPVCPGLDKAAPIAGSGGFLLP
jgi:hypothetical protein